MKKIDYKAFQAKMNSRDPDHPVTEEEAAEALRNMAEFILALYRINGREQIIPLEQAMATEPKPIKQNQEERP